MREITGLLGTVRTKSRPDVRLALTSLREGLGAASCRAQSQKWLLTSHRRRHLGDPQLGFLDDLERLLDRGQRVNGDVDDSGEGQVRNDIAELFRGADLDDESAGSFARERKGLFDARLALLENQLVGLPD